MEISHDSVNLLVLHYSIYEQEELAVADGRIRAVTTLAGVAFLGATLSSCSGADVKPAGGGADGPVIPASSAAAATVTSSAHRVPTSAAPVVWTTAEAARRYLVMVAPLNAQQRIMKSLIRGKDAGSVDVTAVQASAGKLVQLEDGFARALIGGRWPAAVKSTVGQLVDQVIRRRDSDQQSATARTGEDIIALWNGPYPGIPAAEKVRLLLGLPGTPTI